jgi:hypothetical protein
MARAQDRILELVKTSKESKEDSKVVDFLQKRTWKTGYRDRLLLSSPKKDLEYQRYIKDSPSL